MVRIKHLLIHLAEELHERFKDTCRLRDVSMNSVIQDFIEGFVEMGAGAVVRVKKEGKEDADTKEVQS